MTEAERLSPFDDDVVRSVGAASNVGIQRLEEAVADHQRTMQENPGVEDLVYEWRKQYDNPVIHRTESVFILAVPPTVWEEYGRYLDFTDELLGAVTAVHQEQTIKTVDGPLSGVPEGCTAVVVGRQ